MKMKTHRPSHRALLLAVPAANVERFRAACAEAQQAYWAIGEVVDGEGIEVV